MISIFKKYIWTGRKFGVIAVSLILTIGILSGSLVSLGNGNLGNMAMAEANTITISASPRNNNVDIYELKINGEVVIRYRTLPQGYTAAERSKIIAYRFKQYATQGLISPNNISTGIINGMPVVTVGGKLLATVTSLDAEANQSSMEGLIGVWAKNISGAIADQDQLTPKVQQPPQIQQPSNNKTPAETPSVSGLSADEQKMLNLVNQERAKAGLKLLQMDLNIVKVARLKSQDMISNKYFAHNSPVYGSPFDMMNQFNISYRTAGENLAGASTVDRAHTNLMNSPGHRANILNSSFTHIGIGVIDGGPYGKMFTQLFVGR
ncbi:MAG: CAP domain-containing protein [Bacillota bacterium]|nr:CAP domain-containing protein [Bacillota bacterium]